MQMIPPCEGPFKWCTVGAKRSVVRACVYKDFPHSCNEPSWPRLSRPACVENVSAKQREIYKQVQWGWWCFSPFQGEKWWCLAPAGGAPHPACGHNNSEVLAGEKADAHYSRRSGLRLLYRLSTPKFLCSLGSFIRGWCWRSRCSGAPFGIYDSFHPLAPPFSPPSTCFLDYQPSSFSRHFLTFFFCSLVFALCVSSVSCAISASILCCSCCPWLVGR